MIETLQALTGWRKMLAGAFVVVVATVVLWVGKIDQTAWTDVVQWVVAFFGGANAVEWVGKAFSKK